MDRPRSHRRLALIASAAVLLAAGTLLAVLAVTGGSDPRTGPRPLVYSDLAAAIDDRRVVSAEVDAGEARVTVTLEGGRRAELGFPPDDERLADRLTAAGARVTVRSDHGRPLPAPVAALLIILVVLASIAVVRFVARRRSQAAAGGDMDLRKNAKVDDEERPSILFRDVAGCEEVVEEVAEFVEFLRDPLRFASVGAAMPSGVILYGPPGTGKTLLAKALAGEAGCSFFAVSGSDFVEQFVGVGAKRVRELFTRARAAKEGAVIFIDEIDSIGKKRSGHAGGTEEREGTLNELLVQLDGFPTDRRVVVVAATNRLDMLDPALLRPGRFARQVRVDLPTEEGRREILGLHARGKPLAADVDLDRLARVTGGCSGADLADMLNEAAIMAARQSRGTISQEDLEEGFLRAIAGPEKRSGGLSDDEKRTVAAHEAGHVLAAELCRTADKAQRATIRPRGRAAGLAVYGRTDRSLHSPQSMHEQLVCLLGGRAAEWVTFGRVSSGAGNDLQQANNIARTAVQELGLSPLSGAIVSNGETLSEATRAGMDSEVERLVAEAYRDAITLLEEHRAELDNLSGALLSAEDIDRAEILAAIGRPLTPRDLEPGFGLPAAAA